ncbi:MAG: hypothetical protein OXU81_10840 [Gammaproteobacteria bacterium]|nr:hypothetical protein [Gammaproteobacteria bacterium]
MQIKWSFKGNGVADHDALFDCYSAKELDSPTRSTIPLLEYWRSPEARLRELTAVLGLPLPTSVELNFEHTVKPRRGRGKASCTDLMVIAAEFVVAIEAKWTEPRYETVEDWLRDSENRAEVLRGWCDLLEQRGTKPIRKGDLRGLPYQMIHRAASACHAQGAATSRWLVYLSFDTTTKERDEYLVDLRRLRDVLGAESTLRIALAECTIEPSERLIQLRRRWTSGERRLHGSVRQEAKSGGLLRTELKNLHRVTA